MAKEAKYIVLRERDQFNDRVQNIYPFNSLQIHKDVAIKIGGELGPRRVVGAGFIRFEPDGPICYGKSVSLKVESRPEDTILAKRAFGEEY